MLLKLLLGLIAPGASQEAMIVGTSQSSALHWNGNKFPASMLVDELALDGRWSDAGGCAATNGKGIQWFSLELETPGIVRKVQIARRMYGSWEQGQRIRITIGSSKGYDSNDPLCLPEIPELKREVGLVDYVCNPGQEGKFVTISTTKRVMALCEVRVFTQGK